MAPLNIFRMIRWKEKLAMGGERMMKELQVLCLTWRLHNNINMNMGIMGAL
jgi:hypothetical protein